MLRRIRDTFAWMDSYRLSGVWRVLKRLDLGWRWARPARFSPDPAYMDKQARLLNCLQAVARWPDQVVLVFLDEMGFFVGRKVDGPGRPAPPCQITSCRVPLITDSV